MEDRYIMNPSPIPKFDNPKLHEAECLYLFGAGREKKIYAIPPHTKVVSLAFDDVPFERESFARQEMPPVRQHRHLSGRDLRFGNRRAVLPVLRYILLQGGALQVNEASGNAGACSVQHLTVRYGDGCPHCLPGHAGKKPLPRLRHGLGRKRSLPGRLPRRGAGHCGGERLGKSTLMQSLYFDLEPNQPAPPILQNYDGGEEEHLGGERRRKAAYQEHA